MFLTNKPSTIAPGESVEITLDRDLLAADLTISVPYYEEPANWDNVILVFKTESSLQSKKLVFGASNIATLSLSDRAMLGTMELVRVTLQDFDGGSFSVDSDGIADVEDYNISIAIPAQIPVEDYFVWYKADSEQFSELSNGAEVSNWLPEDGGIASPTPNKGSGSVLYRTSVASLNNMPALEFLGTSGSLINNIADISTLGVTFFVVSQRIAGLSDPQIPLGATKVSIFNGIGFSSAGNGYKPEIRIEGKWKIFPSDLTNWSGNPDPSVVGIAIDNATREDSYLNGYNVNSTAGDQGPTNPSSMGQMQISGYASQDYSGLNGIQLFKGYIAEVVIFNRVLSIEELGEMNDYLLEKYAIPTYSQ